MVALPQVTVEMGAILEETWDPKVDGPPPSPPPPTPLLDKSQPVHTTSPISLSKLETLPTWNGHVSQREPLLPSSLYPDGTCALLTLRQKHAKVRNLVTSIAVTQTV
jgi:hypothetical protein